MFHLLSFQSFLTGFRALAAMSRLTYCCKIFVNIFSDMSRSSLSPSVCISALTIVVHTHTHTPQPKWGGGEQVQRKNENEIKAVMGGSIAGT